MNSTLAIRSHELPPYAQENMEGMMTSDLQEPKSCPHQHGPPTPVLDAHLRHASTRARIEDLRSALGNIIDSTDEGQCIKCATSQAAGALFAYLKDLREAKHNGEYSKDDKRALKKEVRGLAKDLKKELKNDHKSRKLGHRF